jgi:hypothetical protein
MRACVGARRAVMGAGRVGMDNTVCVGMGLGDEQARIRGVVGWACGHGRWMCAYGRWVHRACGRW